MACVVEVTEGLTLSTELTCHRAHALLMTGNSRRDTAFESGMDRR